MRWRIFILKNIIFKYDIKGSYRNLILDEFHKHEFNNKLEVYHQLYDIMHEIDDASQSWVGSGEQILMISMIDVWSTDF